MHLKHKKKIYPITDDLALISKILTPTFDAEVITLGLRAFHDRSEICTLSSSLYCKKNQNTRWSTLIFFLRKPSIKIWATSYPNQNWKHIFLVENIF